MYVLPIHVVSIVARMLGWGRLYVALHGVWHIGSAHAVFSLLEPMEV
jgi:hypothetical protein